MEVAEVKLFERYASNFPDEDYYPVGYSVKEIYTTGLRFWGMNPDNFVPALAIKLLNRSTEEEISLKRLRLPTELTEKIGGFVVDEKKQAILEALNSRCPESLKFIPAMRSILITGIITRQEDFQVITHNGEIIGFSV